MNQSTTWWPPLGHIFSYYPVRHFRLLLLHMKLDPPGPFTLWFLMQPLEISNVLHTLDISWRHYYSCPPLTMQEPKSGRWSVAAASGGFLASGQPQAISKLADVSALLSSQVCLLILASPKPLPGRNQPLYPTPHTHIYICTLICSQNPKKSFTTPPSDWFWWGLNVYLRGQIHSSYFGYLTRMVSLTAALSYKAPSFLFDKIN